MHPFARRSIRTHAARATAAVLAVAFPLTLAACSGSSSPSTESSGSASDTGTASEPAASWTPEKDIEWIVPYSPGGGFDTYSRGIAQVMQEDGHLPSGVNVVVRNITPLPQGLTTLYSAKPDGYTVGILPMPAAISQQIQAPDVAHWETDKYTVLGQVDENAYVVYVPANSPYKTIDDLIAAKNLKALTVEEGSSSALATQATIQTLGLDATITYGAEGSAEVVAAALRGDADFFVYGTTDVTGFLDSGDVRAILFIGTEDQRPASLTWLKDVPGAEQAGYPDLAGTVTELRIIVGPPDLPPEVADYLRTAVYDTISSDAFAAWAKQADRPIVPRNFEDAKSAMDAQIERMKVLVPELTGKG